MLNRGLNNSAGMDERAVVKNGHRSLDPASLVIHGDDGIEQTADIAPPIHPTSTFAAGNAAEFAVHVRGKLLQGGCVAIRPGAEKSRGFRGLRLLHEVSID